MERASCIYLDSNNDCENAVNHPIMSLDPGDKPYKYYSREPPGGGLLCSVYKWRDDI